MAQISETKIYRCRRLCHVFSFACKHSCIQTRLQTNLGSLDSGGPCRCQLWNSRKCQSINSNWIIDSAFWIQSCGDKEEILVKLPQVFHRLFTAVAENSVMFMISDQKAAHNENYFSSLATFYPIVERQTIADGAPLHTCHCPIAVATIIPIASSNGYQFTCRLASQSKRSHLTMRCVISF